MQRNWIIHVGIFRMYFVFKLVTSDYMTRRIVEEIKFYDCVKPFEFIKEGVFGSGAGLEDEHLITINLNLSHERYSYQDAFEWNLSSIDVYFYLI